MKQLILTSALFLTATLGFAQNITEPEYKGQVAVINTDSTTTLLQKETGEHKAKSSAFALVPIPGASLLDRTKAYLTVKGAESPNKISSKKFSLIIRVKDNSEEPKNAFGIFKFETKKKERRFKMADIGFGSAIWRNNLFLNHFTEGIKIFINNLHSSQLAFWKNLLINFKIFFCHITFFINFAKIMDKLSKEYP